MSDVASPRFHRRIRRTADGIPLPRNLDGRSTEARRFKIICGGIVADLGGSDLLTDSDKIAVAQIATLTMAAERLREDAVVSGSINTDSIIRLMSEARRSLSRLQSKAARSKPSGPSLQDYLAQRAAKDA
jgi:hypothetical protein